MSIQLADVSNDGIYPGAACRMSQLQCYNYHQYTKTLTETWQPYEVDFDQLTRRLATDQGFFTTSQFDRMAAIGIQFVMAAQSPDGGLPTLDGGLDLTFNLCVSQIYFVPL
ncbi:MAG: hypothetical protein M3O46_09820 [Myxococcota bacterium]|nr:hypothetical protein [Myxococcota bacterium]